MDPSLNPSSHSASSTSPAVQDEFRSSDDYTSVSNAIDVALLSSTQSSMSSIPSFLSLTTCENSDNDAESLVIASSPTGSKPRQQQEQQPQAQLKQTCQDTPTQQQRPTSTLSTNTISSRSTLDRELTVRSKHTSTASTTSTLKHFSIIFTDVNESSSAASPTISSSPQNVANAPDSCSINSMQPKGTSAPSLYASDTHNPSVMPTSASQTPSFSYSYSTTDSPSNSNASVSSLNSITENVSILSYKRDNNKQHKKFLKPAFRHPPSSSTTRITFHRCRPLTTDHLPPEHPRPPRGSRSSGRDLRSRTDLETLLWRPSHNSCPFSVISLKHRL